MAKLLRDMHAAGKPIGALCIAPAVLAKVFGETARPQITIGNDAGTAQALESMGARHADADSTGIVVDDANKMVTTPCYMLAGRITEVATGAERAVEAMLELAGG